MASLEQEYQVSLFGWDIDRPDETQVFLNGTSIGFLTQGLDSTYGKKDTFILDSSLLNVGANSIELGQRVPDSAWQFFQDEKWAVQNIKVSEVKKPIITPIIMFVLSHDSTL